MTELDVDRVAEIRTLPEVARWFPVRNEEYLAAKLARDDLMCWVIELQGRDRLRSSV